MTSKLDWCYNCMHVQDILFIIVMVGYFCHHLSDNYVDLTDLYVDLSDHYVDLSDNFVVTCICVTSTGQKHVFKDLFLTNE